MFIESVVPQVIKNGETSLERLERQPATEALAELRRQLLMTDVPYAAWTIWRSEVLRKLK